MAPDGGNFSKQMRYSLRSLKVRQEKPKIDSRIKQNLREAERVGYEQKAMKQ